MKRQLLVVFLILGNVVYANHFGHNLRLLNKLQQIHPKAYSSLGTLYNTYEIATYCIKNNIQGDFVECGVAAGAQVAVMAYTCQEFGVRKKIHLFDSFEGIPLAGPNDDEQPGIGKISHNTNVSDLNNLLVSSGVSAWSLEAVKQCMCEWGVDESLLVYHKGWFQRVLPHAVDDIHAISFLRLDGDLYESTKVCLEYLYPKISKGGYIVIDDYNSLTGCRKAVSEYLQKHGLKPKIITVEGVTNKYTFANPVYWQVT